MKQEWSPPNRRLAAGLAAARRAAHLRQVDVAHALGVSVSAVAHWENAYLPIPAETRQRIEAIIARAERQQAQKAQQAQDGQREDSN
jgi:transcriptional regulator with XRE-family HTH domain